jgi:hypothetical protein
VAARLLGGAAVPDATGAPALPVTTLREGPVHHVHRRALGALTLGLAACAGPATVDPAPAVPEPVPLAERAEPDTDPRLVEALARLVARPAGRFRYEVRIDLGDDAEAEALGPVVTAFEGRYDPGAGAWAVGPAGSPTTLPEDGPAFDPVVTAEVLRGAGPLEDDGDDAVEGMPARRYRTVVHLDDVLDRVGDVRRAPVGAELDQLADLLDEVGAPADSDALDAVVWLAADGALLRLELDPPVGPGTFGPGATVRLTLDLYDDGGPSPIDAAGGRAAP